MTRPLDPATSTALDKPVLPLAVILSLDIVDDPLFAWSGIGDLVFGAAETGDPSLDGKTFLGTGSIIEVSTVSEGVGGSDALDVSMPGVSLNEPLLRQLIRDRKRWQFRRAVAWGLVLHPVTGAIEGKPFRIKTGRMDRMPFVENDKQGIVKVKIEGQQAYGNTPLATRYNEAIDINPNDVSGKYVHSLANMTANLGQVSAAAGTNYGSGVGTSGGNKFFGRGLDLN